MSFKVHADIVSLFKGLLISIEPFAASQEVILKFIEPSTKQIYYYNPINILPKATVFLCRIISFTPQSYQVIVALKLPEPNSNHLVLQVTNSGADLSKVGEILEVYGNQLNVESLKNEGTRFTIEIDVQNNEDNTKNIKVGQMLPKQYPAYYKEINKRLSTHFANLSNLEDLAMSKGINEGVFLKKVNMVINTNLVSERLNVSLLASSMALSRAQLFRKIKLLTKMSPSQYILFFRLEIAKKLLLAKDEDFNVTEVSYRTGFSSISHFSRSFQKQFGFNPSECK